MNRIYTILSDFIRLIYPKLCVVCHTNLVRGEEHICTSCLYDLPRTNMHLTLNNEAEKRFWGKVEIKKATSFLFYEKGGVTQKIINSIKYKDNKELAVTMARHAATDINKSEYYADIDIIVPVPLHPTKERKRGYNQSEWICKGLSEIMQKPYSTQIIERAKANPSQTKKSVYERHTNTQGIFQLKSDKVNLEGKHLLLVDDVLTTGATLEACITALSQIPNCKISIFTLAIAK